MCLCDISVRGQETPTLPGIVASGGCGGGRRESAQVPFPANTQDQARGPSLSFPHPLLIQEGLA